MHPRLKAFAPYFVLSVLCLSAAILRPLLPIDETRYLTVAWEMFERGNYILPTLNFAPYHHKPPLLFWLIDLSWGLFGVSRWSAMIPVFVISASVMALTRNLFERLFPEKKDASYLVPWLLLSSFPFLIYGTMVMFDLLVAVLLLSVLISFLDYARAPAIYKPLLAGIALGFGALAKGPVIYLYALWPLALYAYWRREEFVSKKKFYAALLICVFVSFIPPLLWLAPALARANGDFAFWLLWEQTAGRISGKFGASHARPDYFYIVFLPALAMPWIFLPSFWRNARQVFWNANAFRFIAAATIPAFISFSLIAGKQPHYLLPFLPFIAAGLTFILSSSPRAIVRVAVLMAALFVAGHAVAARTIFPKYDLEPFAAFYRDHREADWAFVRKYQGEIGFLARAEKPIASLEKDDLPDWFAAHPGGYAIIRYRGSDDLGAFKEVFSRSYKGKKLGIFQRAD